MKKVVSILRSISHFSIFHWVCISKYRKWNLPFLFAYHFIVHITGYLRDSSCLLKITQKILFWITQSLLSPFASFLALSITFLCIFVGNLKSICFRTPFIFMRTIWSAYESNIFNLNTWTGSPRTCHHGKRSMEHGTWSRYCT